MKTARLIRASFTADGTFGSLHVDNYAYRTGELPWNDNEPLYSCIPPGSYQCAYTYSEKFGKETYILQGVKGRFGIRIHSANFVGDKRRGKLCQIEGCIALGMLVGPLEGQQAILKSNYAVASFEAVMEKKPFLLEISSVPLL